jgi:Flp pilus assembly protein TadB
MSVALVCGLATCAALTTLLVDWRPGASMRSALIAAFATAGALATASVSAPVCLVAGALVGLFIGDRARRLVRRREARLCAGIERALPDALDLLAGLVESGAPLGPALAAVAPRIEGPLRAELEACASALGASGSRRAAFGLLRQSGSADLARVGQALALADELGTGVAEQLRGQALVQRDLRRSRAREQAGAAAPKVALVIGLVLVPAALSLVLGAELLSALDAARGP